MPQPSNKIVYMNCGLSHQLIGGMYSVAPIDLIAMMIRSEAVEPCDRTGQLQSRVNTHIVDEIPSIGQFNESFSDICYERANELLSRNKTTTVFWSGGIDSTVALTALMQVATNNSQIKVIYEERSIEEYPWFYEKYVKKLNHELLDKFIWRYELDENEITVDGNCGDQLFGSVSLSEKEGIKDKPWREFIDCDELFSFGLHVLANKTFTKRSIRNFVLEHIEDHITACPFEIKTIFDLYWWLNFTIKWQTVSFRAFTCKPFSQDLYENTYSFFNTPDFQRWSMVNHDLKVKDTTETYKFVAKDFIHDFTKDADYRDNKLKKSSGARRFSKDPEVNGQGDLILMTDKVAGLIDGNFNSYGYQTALCSLQDFMHLKNPNFNNICIDLRNAEWQ